jgi:hypothetical protein
MDARNKMNTKFYLQISKVRYHMEDLGIDGKDHIRADVTELGFWKM